MLWSGTGIGIYDEYKTENDSKMISSPQTRVIEGQVAPPHLIHVVLSECFQSIGCRGGWEDSLIIDVILYI